MQQLAHKWDAELYNDKHAFVYKYGASLIDLLDAKPYERILDLGCGSGELTHLIREKSTEVIGFDKSPEMIEKARMQFPLIDFQVADASDFQFDEPFDAIFSNALKLFTAAIAIALSPSSRIFRYADNYKIFQ